MKDNKDLQSFLNDNNIEAEIIEVGDTKTAEKASKRLGIDPNVVVKDLKVNIH